MTCPQDASVLKVGAKNDPLIAHVEQALREELYKKTAVTFFLTVGLANFNADLGCAVGKARVSHDRAVVPPFAQKLGVRGDGIADRETVICKKHQFFLQHAGMPGPCRSPL